MEGEWEAGKGGEVVGFHVVTWSVSGNNHLDGAARCGPSVVDMKRGGVRHWPGEQRGVVDRRGEAEAGKGGGVVGFHVVTWLFSGNKVRSPASST